MSRGRNTSRLRSPLAPAPLRSDEAWVAEALETLERGLPVELDAEGERILAGEPLDQEGPLYGGVAGDERKSALDLLEAALWFQGAGAQCRLSPPTDANQPGKELWAAMHVKARDTLAAAHDHQQRHLDAAAEAVARPRTARSRRLMEAHNIAGGLSGAQARSRLMRDAVNLLELIDSLLRDPGGHFSGPASQHARLMRVNLTRMRLATPKVNEALLGGRLEAARGLISAVHQANGDEGHARRSASAGRTQLAVAAALERAEQISREYGRALPRRRAPISPGFIDLAGMEQRMITEALGERHVGLLRPDDATDAPVAGCAHASAAWAPCASPEMVDALGLVCPDCRQRLVVVPAHRLPEGLTPAPGLETTRIIENCRTWPEDYLYRERRSRALTGKAVPPRDASFEQLRADEGVDDLDTARHLAQLEPHTRERPTSLAGALSLRR